MFRRETRRGVILVESILRSIQTRVFLSLFIPAFRCITALILVSLVAHIAATKWQSIMRFFARLNISHELLEDAKIRDGDIISSNNSITTMKVKSASRHWNLSKASAAAAAQALIET